ncbi:MAG: FtsX-like permease family protein, partial [Cyclobacteriaceae bacterium]|nr:FtsX-like permease family protein [Cyclobacteriaceae bacterium]
TLLEGSPDQVLKDKTSIVISEEVALGLFGQTKDLIGRTIDWQHTKSYLVSGVFKKIPSKSSYQFDFVLSFEDFKDDNKWTTQWGNNGPSTYIKLHGGSSAAVLTSKIKNFVKDRNEDSHVELFLQQYDTRYLHGKYDNGIQAGGRIEYVRLFSVIAFFVLLIACINFMNLSTARASRRAKEIGVKKIVGAYRESLILQFLMESVLIATCSLIVALAAVWLFLPEFNDITGKHIAFTFSADFLLAMGVITLFTGLVAGSYPALYLSGFNPLKVIKGQTRGSIGELMARRGLVVFQFFLSILMIVGVLIVYNQINYVQNKNLGYNKDNLIKFSAEGRIAEDMNTFLTEIRKIPGVVGASSMGHNLMGRNNNTSGLSWPGKPEDQSILFENVRVNHGLLELLDLEVTMGRLFSEEYSTDTTKIIFNEAAMKIMNLRDPIGTTIRLWDEYDLEIIGIVKDFNFESLHDEVKPLFFVLNDQYTYNVMVRIEQGREKETLTALDNFYKTFNPGFSFDYTFQDEEYALLYATEQRIASLSRYFAGFGVLISCLGLFGLAAFTAERRIKEIGIRKALGASESGIVVLLSKDFTRLVLVSILLALPLSYYLAGKWLEEFAYRIELSFGYFFASGIIALLVAWLTVGSQAIRAARVNPSDCLRNDQ